MGATENQLYVPGYKRLFLAAYFQKNDQLFYEPKGVQTLPMVCRGNRVYSTNVKDIVLMKTSENIDVKLLKIEPEDVSYAAEIPSLSLFLQFKMEVMERQKNALGKSVLCKMNLKEPGDSPPPHRVGNKMFLFRWGDIVYKFVCLADHC